MLIVKSKNGNDEQKHMKKHRLVFFTLVFALLSIFFYASTLQQMSSFREGVVQKDMHSIHSSIPMTSLSLKQSVCFDGDQEYELERPAHKDLSFFSGVKFPSFNRYVKFFQTTSPFLNSPSFFIWIHALRL